MAVLEMAMVTAVVYAVVVKMSTAEEMLQRGKSEFKAGSGNAVCLALNHLSCNEIYNLSSPISIVDYFLRGQ